MTWTVTPPSASPAIPSTTYSAWGSSPPASGALRVDASTFSGVGINVTGSTSNILTGALTGVTTINGQTISATAAFTGAMTVGTPTGGMPAAGVINAQGLKINGVDVSTSTDTYWTASAPGIRYDSPVGLGGAPVTSVSLYILGSGLLTTDQRGIYVTPVFASTATASGYALYAAVHTAASAYTMTQGHAVSVGAPSLGNTAVTTICGLYVANQGQAKSTNAYGVYISAQSGAASTNIGLYNEGTTTLIGAVTMSAALTVNATGSVFSAGTDASTTFTIGTGGAAPSATRSAILTLNSAHSGSFVGSSGVKLWRNGAEIWQFGIDTDATSNVKNANTNFYWYGNSEYRMALTANGQLRVSGGFYSYTPGTTSLGLSINGDAGYQRQIKWFSAGSLRWNLHANSTPEGGGNTGSDFQLDAYNDAGVGIDTPIGLIRAAGGALTIARPVVITNGLAVAGAAISASTALNLPAATTALSSLRLAHGAAPTSPVDGDMWTTTAGLFVRINGVTKTVTLT